MRRVHGAPPCKDLQLALYLHRKPDHQHNIATLYDGGQPAVEVERPDGLVDHQVHILAEGPSVVACNGHVLLSFCSFY